MSDPILTDIDFKNKMAWVWATLEFLEFFFFEKSIFGSFCQEMDCLGFWGIRRFVF